MKAEAQSLKDILEREPHRLEVPFFQRRYVWSEENWSEMLESISNFKEEKEFWGSIIIKMAKDKGPKGCTKGYIIDGQQRLTTLAILTKAIYDTVDENNKKRIIKYIENDLFFAPQASALFSDYEYEIIIEHSRADRKDYEEIIKAGIYNEHKIDLDSCDSSKIKSCYAYFRNELKDKSTSELLEMINVLYGDEKVFVLIMLEENDVNEQIIFDAINRAGQKLYTSDIIKNNLFKALVDKTANQNEVNILCDKMWDAIFWTDNETSIWDEKRNFGNVGKSHLDFLLYSVACIEWPDTSIKQLNEKLEKIYLEHTEKMDEGELKHLIEKIAKIAIIYKKYIIDFGSNIDEEIFRKNDDVKRLLLIMEKLRIQMFYPFVLKEFYENIISIDIEKQSVTCDFNNLDLKKKMNRLETYIMRRRLCSSSTSKYSDKCLEIIKNGIDVLYGGYTDETIKKENLTIQTAINTLKADVAKITLFCLELEKWEEADDLGRLSYTYQLEHIMPQKWEKYWPIEEKTEESVERRKLSVDKIGNMILLSQKLNDQISNREFSVKMQGEPAKGRKSAKEGYKDRCQLKLTKQIVDEYNAGDTTWDESRIEARTNQLYKEILEHWKVEQLFLVKENQN